MKTKSLLLFGLAVVSFAAFADDPITKVFDLPYVESQGVTRSSEVDNWGSVLQTDCQLTSKSVVEIELELFSIEKDSTIFCNRVSSSSKSTYSLFYILNKGWRFDYNSSTAAYGGMPEAGKRYKLKLSPEGLWVDGVKTIEKTPKDFELPTKICFFATYTYKAATDDAPESYSDYSSWGNGKAKIYSFKVYEPDADGELQLAYELQPCYASNGKVCLADSAKGIAYTTSRPSYPLASTFTAKAKDGAEGIVTTFGYARSAALNGTSLAGSKFHVAIEPGVYDLKDIAMSTTSHLVANYGKNGWLIGLGKKPDDVVLKGLGASGTLRVLSAGAFSVTNLTVTGGYLSSSNDGGGIYSSSSGIYDCIVTNNYAKGSNGNGGGGIYGAKTVKNCVIAYNRSSNGGGLRSCGTISGCHIFNNEAGAGGGVSGGVVTNACVIERNLASTGGGLTGATAYGCTIVSNSATKASNVIYGGGMSGGKAYDCTFIGNVSNGNGGGTSSTSIFRCKFFDNIACNYGGGSSGSSGADCFYKGNGLSGSFGGGGGAYDGSLTNCVFTANSDRKSATFYGSAAYQSTLVECVITNETAKRRVIARCNLERCRIADCRKVSSDSTYNFCLIGDYNNDGTHRRAVNCVIEDCTCRNSIDRVARATTLVNCTIRNVTGLSNGALDTTCQNVVNTIVADCAPYDIGAANCPTMTNCLYATVSGELTADQSVNCKHASPRWAKPGPGVLPCDIRASSKAFNGGYWDDDIAALVGETDREGRPRVMFGHLDIGALECQDDTVTGLMLHLK